MFYKVVTIWLALVVASEGLLVRDERLDRHRRQNPPGVLSFGQNQNANISPLARFLPDTNIGRSSGGQVNVNRPSGSFGQNTDVLGLFSRQRGVENAGIRDGNNVGATWGDQSNILGNRFGWGNRNNVDVNTRNGQFGVQREKGIRGIATETDRTNVNPLGLQFGQEKRKCFGGAFFGGDGTCTNENKGLNGR